MATGVSATMVPTLVPIDKEIKQEARKMPANKRLSGRIWSMRLILTQNQAKFLNLIKSMMIRGEMI